MGNCVYWFLIWFLRIDVAHGPLVFLDYQKNFLEYLMIIGNVVAFACLWNYQYLMVTSILHSELYLQYLSRLHKIVFFQCIKVILLLGSWGWEDVEMDKRVKRFWRYGKNGRWVFKYPNTDICKKETKTIFPSILLFL